MPATVETRSNELVLTRLFDAPRELVFRAWTDPEQFARWWGPRQSSIPFCEIDLRPGGTIRYAMAGDHFPEHRVKGVFREVDAPSRLVFTQQFVDEHDKPSVHQMIPGWPPDAYFVTTATFASRGNKTELTLRHELVSDSDAAASVVGPAELGWSQSLDRLGEFVDGRDIVGTRIYDAPRELVWRMWTEPEHIARWWGPNGFSLTTHEMDVRPGGVWDFVMHGPDGTDYKNKIIYREVTPHERLAWSHVSGPLFEAEATFQARDDGRTQVTMRMHFASAELRNTVAKQYGAIEGLQQTLGRLVDELQQVFTIRRTFDAPRELVWQAWTEPERLMQWFGPKGGTMLAVNAEIRLDGTVHYGLRFNGVEMWGKWTFREIVPPERLVFVNSFSDRDGGVTRHPFTADWPLELLTIVTFTATAGDKTTVTVNWTPIHATEAERNAFAGARASMQGGWGGTFDQLTDYLARP